MVSKVRTEVVYPELTVSICQGEEGITAAKARQLLGWEEETDTNPFGDDFLFKHGDKKIRLSNDRGNRDISQSWVNQFTQDILTRDWAGPTTLPGETINGEGILITRSGQVAQGQKRLLAIILAEEKWAKKGSRWKSYWKTEPILETLVVYGISDDPRVVQTLDNNQPRSLADVYQTTGFKGSAISRKEKSLGAKMLAAATNFLWERTVVREEVLDQFQTHSASQRFLQNHRKLLECLDFVWKLNENRGLTLLGLSPGHCSAMLYLMAASHTDYDEYHAAATPSDKKCNWDNWDKACKFWQEVIKGDKGKLALLPKVLGRLQDFDTGLGGRITEKVCVLAKAWGIYLNKEEITEEGITPVYDLNRDNLTLNDFPLFGGIDAGYRKCKQQEPDPTPEELKERIEAERARKGSSSQLAKASNEPLPTTALPPEKKKKKTAPKLTKQRSKTRKEVEAEQTQRAAEADAEMLPEEIE